MGRHRDEPSTLNRREFLNRLGYAAPALLPAPLRAYAPFPFALSLGDPALAEFRLKPSYPSPSPLDNMLCLVAPGADAYITEKYTAALQQQLNEIGNAIRQKQSSPETFARLLHDSFRGRGPREFADQRVRSGPGVEILCRKYGDSTNNNAPLGRDAFLNQWAEYCRSLGSVDITEFEIIRVLPATSTHMSSEVRYSLVGTQVDGAREQRIGLWRIDWKQVSSSDWLVSNWLFTEESSARATKPLFVDATAQAFADVDSFKSQLAFGVDHWRTVLDGASGIDVYGNNGIAVSDFDGDGRDDIYVCQPSGLPNRLYRNRGDGMFEDVTDRAGVGVLDPTSCALFADVQNRGVQDLLVVCNSGPLLFLNQGNGTFARKADAFSFAKPPEGTFTHAAIADYDHDGRLDIYFCVYTYYLGLDQYHYPSPYFDARNGPPNFLLHNEGNGKFVDRTAASGLNAENDRYSFACAWGDISGNGGPDLYVANDFGRSNLYRNNGDGRFSVVSDESGTNLPGAGMSSCWCDFDNKGKQDIYVSNMWSAAGHRVSESEPFHAQDSAETRSFYRRHARGNSLYRNQGNGKFVETGEPSGTAMGRWAWSADAWDFDHDGYSDLYVANGYISGTAEPEVSSFFWRQVVGNSPANATPNSNYEHGWNAINELIRSDHSWSGFERNTVYLNNRDGSFSDISGVSGLDLLEDGRAFALADLDGDGRQEVVLKNRNAPQISLLRNAMSELGSAVSVRLRGTKSNRDAIGAAVTVRSGNLHQTKYLQAGTGFLSQHSKELFFGLGTAEGKVSVAVRWPRGMTQEFADIPPNHRITIEEGNALLSTVPFSAHAPIEHREGAASKSQPSPASISTWLLEPLLAPGFSLPDLSGKLTSLSGGRGRPTLLQFWSIATPQSIAQLRELERAREQLTANGIRVIALNVDNADDMRSIRDLASSQKLTLPILLAGPNLAGVYNILYRFLFDRRRDLPIPCAFLLDESNLIVKVYQGLLEASQILADASVIPRTYEARVAKALPFPGKLYGGQFKRNDFTYGVALFQHGYLDPAAESFKQVIAAQPQNAEAYYNLGTLYLRKDDFAQARGYLEQTIKLRPQYPEAWNNLGMVAAQQNQLDEAIGNFKQSLALRPDYVTALLNLGNIERRQGNTPEAGRLLNRAAELEPQNAEANYSLGMLYAHQNDVAQATELLQKSVALRPDYPDAINNLGVLYVRQGKNAEAEQQFTTCIRVAPNFDQAYLNLARLYMLEQEKEKAREILQALLKLQPDHKLAQQALGMLN
jgi:Flp pilus assembly protein TadD/peroxiredoxin